jgi:5-methylcytosine-specific restriction enzyme A
MRKEFSAKIKVLAFQRADGKCEGCGLPLLVGKYHYDHINADGLTGEPTLDNCAVLCSGPGSCHSLKTKVDVAHIAKAKRRMRKAIGAKQSRNPLPGSKASGLRKRMNGSVERW